MADHEGVEPRDPRLPGELFRSTSAPSPSAVHLAEALGSLDRATRDFTRRLGEGHLEMERARMAGEQALRDNGHHDRPAAQNGTGPARGAHEPGPARAAEAPVDPRAAFDRHMRDAELEAREYLESAKRRADSLVSTMVGAVEHEAAQIRRGAEEGIRARWNQVEVDATRHVENARRVAAQMVAERQSRIASLSDGISGRAEALTAGLDDAARVRAQFEAFVHALSVTADRIASEPARGTTGGELHDLRHRPQPSAMAA